MDLSLLLLASIICLAAWFVVGRSRSLALSSGSSSKTRGLNSLPYYYGLLTLIWAALPALVLFVTWSLFDDQIIYQQLVERLPAAVTEKGAEHVELVVNQIYGTALGSTESGTADYIQDGARFVAAQQSKSRWMISGLVICVILIAGALAYFRITPQLKARSAVERFFRMALLACACIAILTTLGILLSVLFESIRFFSAVSPLEFLFGLEWSPQSAIRADQEVGKSTFGAVPLFVGTLLIAFIAMLVAVPTGLMSAIYLSEYAPRRTRTYIKPLLEILAGIPTVVYGFFAALVVAPLIRNTATALGLDEMLAVSSESALAAGLVMGVMIIPFVSSLSDDVINAVPQSLRDGALGLGATKSEVIKQVVIPAALPGIVGAILLAVSRAIGETMIVVMAAGLAANLTLNPFDSVTTVTVQIVTLLVGDQEFDSAKTLAAFALGLMLFVTTLCLNYIALAVVKRYREQYD